MSDFGEMRRSLEKYGNAEQNLPQKACALTKKFNCVCPACNRNDIDAGNAAVKKEECNKPGPTL